VPVYVGHSESVNIETQRKLTANDARALLAAAPGIQVYDDPAHKLYPMPLDVAGKDDVYVGRIREDESTAHGLNLWVVADNLRKGAALNAVQIAELLIR
jgi:aspartate-semialdehyde dehydrogenase